MTTKPEAEKIEALAGIIKDYVKAILESAATETNKRRLAQIAWCADDIVWHIMTLEHRERSDRKP